MFLLCSLCACPAYVFVMFSMCMSCICFCYVLYVHVLHMFMLCSLCACPKYVFVMLSMCMTYKCFCYALYMYLNQLSLHFQRYLCYTNRTAPLFIVAHRCKAIKEQLNKYRFHFRNFIPCGCLEVD